MHFFLSVFEYTRNESSCRSAERLHTLAHTGMGCGSSSESGGDGAAPVAEAASPTAPDVEYLKVKFGQRKKQEGIEDRRLPLA